MKTYGSKDSSPTLRNCTIRGSRVYGLNCWRSDPLIETCQFVGNLSYAMAMRIDSFVRLKNNTATGNGQNAIAIYESWPGRSGTWVKDNLPYTLLNYVGINTDQTLTIEPGVIVQFQNPERFVAGRWRVNRQWNRGATDSLYIDRTRQATGAMAANRLPQRVRRCHLNHEQLPYRIRRPRFRRCPYIYWSLTADS